MSIHFTREGFGNLFEVPKTFNEITETVDDDKHESELTLGELVLDTTAAVVAHKAPINTSVGVLLYGIAKNSDQNQIHGLAGGVVHLFLDTCVEITFERLAHSLAVAGVDGVFLKPLAPMGAVIPLILGAHVVRIFKDAAICYLPSNPFVPLTMGDPEVASTVEDVKNFLNFISLPSYGLEMLHHYILNRVVSGLHHIGVTDQHIDMVTDAAKFPIQTLGASILGPGSNIPEFLGRDRVTPLIPQGASRERLQRVFDLVRSESQAARYFWDVQIKEHSFRRPIASRVSVVAAILGYPARSNSKVNSDSCQSGKARWSGRSNVAERIPSGLQNRVTVIAPKENFRFLPGCDRHIIRTSMAFGTGGKVRFFTQYGSKDIKAVFHQKKRFSLASRASHLGAVRSKSSEPFFGDAHNNDAAKAIPSLGVRYFQHAKVDVKSPEMSVVSHEEADRITENLNIISLEERAIKEFEAELAELYTYFRAEREGEARARDRVAMQGAMSDAAVAALAFGCPRLGILFQAGHQMMRFEGAIDQIRGIKDLASMDGAIAIGSLAGVGSSMVGMFAKLDNISSDIFGTLMEQMRQYNAILCGQVQEICRQVAHFHAETKWEFGRVRNELFCMYEDLKAIQLQVTKEAKFLKQDVGIGFLRVKRDLDLLGRETCYQIQELRLEELRRVEDGINHYEPRTVVIDTVKGWAATLERWMTNPPFKQIVTGRAYAGSDKQIGYLKAASIAGRIGLLAEVAKAKKIIEIEDAAMDVLINLDTLEALLPAYVTVLKMLREAGVVYDLEEGLWQKIILDSIRGCEVVSDKLEEKRAFIEKTFAENTELLGSFREHFSSYKMQITRVRRSIEQKKAEIKSMPCIIRTAEKFDEVAAHLDVSEGLLANKLQELIAALAAQKRGVLNDVVHLYRFGLLVSV